MIQNSCNKFFLIEVLFNYYLFLVTLCSLWDLSSLTRDQTHGPCSGSTESKPLDSQGIPIIQQMFIEHGHVPGPVLGTGDGEVSQIDLASVALMSALSGGDGH